MPSYELNFGACSFRVAAPIPTVWNSLSADIHLEYANSVLIKNVTLNKLKKYKGELPNLLFHYENSHTRNVYSV